MIPFIVAGYPSVAATETIVDTLVSEGAELIELGVPYSDPIADGPVIQAASMRASQVLGEMNQVLELAARIGSKHPNLRIILFTYYNPIFKMGFENFARRAQDANIAAVLTVDLPLEEADEYRVVLDHFAIKTVFLASPTTSPERLRRIAEASTGFIYYVSRIGVTGVKNDLSPSLRHELQELRKITDKPIAVGFGISTPEQVAIVGQWCDAVVVGSATVLRFSV